MSDTADKDRPRHPGDLSAERLRAIANGVVSATWEVRKMASEILNARIELVEIEATLDAAMTNTASQDDVRNAEMEDRIDAANGE